MAKDYTELAKAIIEKVGGEENVVSVTHCMTRLRFRIADSSKVDETGLKAIDGVTALIIAGGQHQVVIGTNVTDVYNTIGKVTNIKLDGNVDAEKEVPTEKKGFWAAAIDLISALFLPLIGAMAASGVLKGLLVALSTAGVISDEGTTYQLLYGLGDALFYFLPVYLAITAADKFKCNKFVAMSVAGGLISQNLIGLQSAGTAVTLFGLPVQLITYTSSVVPIIFAIYLMSLLEHWLNKVIPSVIRNVVVPLVTLVVPFCVTIWIIGPVTNTVSTLVASGFTALVGLSPAVAGFLFGALWPVLIIFGLHYGFVPLLFTNLATYGYDTSLPLTTGANFSQAGAAFGVFLKTKNRELKQIAGSAALSALLGGITEPAIYGVNMKFKRPFIIACVCTGIGGILCGIAGAKLPGMITNCILTLPALVAFEGGLAMVASAVIGFFGSAIGTFLFGYNDSMLK